MSEAVFDTNIIIDHLRNVSEATNLVERVRSGAISGYISVLTVAEIFSGKDAQNPLKKQLLEDLLNIFSKIEVNEEIAIMGGNLKRRYGTNMIDAIIAATAASLRCKLLTQNSKHFANIGGISVEKPY